MTTTLLFSNFTAWSAQIAIVVAIGALAALSLSPGRARLVFWQVLLAATLLLPALQPWPRPEADPATVVTVTSTTAAYTVAPPSSRSFTWRNDYVLYLVLAGAALRWLWIIVGFVRLAPPSLGRAPAGLASGAVRKSRRSLVRIGYDFGPRDVRLAAPVDPASVARVRTARRSARSDRVS